MKRGDIGSGLEIMKGVEQCQWKVSMMYFLKKFMIKAIREDIGISEEELLTQYNSIVYDLVKATTASQGDRLKEYLKL